MATYGQKNYNELQGRVSPSGVQPRYRIAQIGCLLTSFTLLLDRLGKGIGDPLAMNRIFRDRGIYIDVDDGVYDDLGWGSITQATNGTVVVTGAGAGWPSSNDTIVKFIYKSPITGKTTPHFCLVEDAKAHTIIDSWDGVVKNPGIYGVPVAYANFGNNDPAPQAVIPVVPPPAPAPPAHNPYEAITPIAFVTNKQPTKVWDLDATKWADFKSVRELDQNTYFVAVGIYHHPLIADYYMDKDSFGAAASNGIPARNEGLNHADLSPAPVDTPPAPTAPIEAPTITTTSADPNSTVITVMTGTSSPLPIVNSPTPVVGIASPNAWKITFEEFPAIRKLIATETVNVTDLDGVEIDLRLLKGKQVWVGGVFEKDGQLYYRTQKSIINGWWYGIPIAALGGYIPIDKSDADISADLDISLIEEAKDLAGKVSKRERLVAIVAKIQGFTISLLTLGFLRKNKNKKEA